MCASPKRRHATCLCKWGAGLDAIGASSALTASTEALARARKGGEKKQERVVQHCRSRAPARAELELSVISTRRGMNA